MARAIGVDLGTRRIGLAISDPAGKLATPLTVLQRTSDSADAQAVVELASAEDVELIVVGYPLALDGTKGDAALVAEAFAAKLTELGATVELFDERLTTAEAEKRLKGRGMKGKQRRQVVDQVAAAVILQGFLDTKKKRR